MMWSVRVSSRSRGAAPTTGPSTSARARPRRSWTWPRFSCGSTGARSGLRSRTGSAPGTSVIASPISPSPGGSSATSRQSRSGTACESSWSGARRRAPVTASRKRTTNSTRKGCSKADHPADPLEGRGPSPDAVEADAAHLLRVQNPPADEVSEFLLQERDGTSELALVQREDRLEKFGSVSVRGARCDERADILREARASEPDPGHEELRIDARVEGNTAEDLVVVDSEAVAQVGEFVCERDFRGEQRVRGVLDRFGRPQGCGRRGAGAPLLSPLRLRRGPGGGERCSRSRGPLLLLGRRRRPVFAAGLFCPPPRALSRRMAVFLVSPQPADSHRYRTR